MPSLIILLAVFIFSTDFGKSYEENKYQISKGDILKFHGFINEDKIEDKVFYPNSFGELKIELSNLDNTVKTIKVNLANYYSEYELDFKSFQSFNVMFNKSKLIINIRNAPKYLDCRTLELDYRDNNFYISKFFDVKINTMDPDLPKDTCLYNFSNPVLFQNINKPIEDFQPIKLCHTKFTSNRTLEEYFSEIKSGTIREKTIDRIKFFLIKNPLSKGTLSIYNDIGYYLEKSGSYNEAKYILDKVILTFPDRTVAYFNLGDAYWGLKDQPKAKEAYNTYISLMKKSGKEAKIPKKVYDRVK